MNAITMAATSTTLSIKRIAELMGDREQQYDGSPGGPFADRLLQYAREGKLRTARYNTHEAYGYSALVNADDLAACMAATGIGRHTTAEGWVKLKCSFAATQNLR